MINASNEGNCVGIWKNFQIAHKY